VNVKKEPGKKEDASNEKKVSTEDKKDTKVEGNFHAILM